MHSSDWYMHKSENTLPFILRKQHTPDSDCTQVTRTYPEGARDDPGNLATIGYLAPENRTIFSRPGGSRLNRHDLPKQCLQEGAFPSPNLWRSPVNLAASSQRCSVPA